MLRGNIPKSFEFIAPLAKRLGFASVGVAPAGPVSQAARASYLDFISKGRAGKMAYMARHRDQRMDVRHPGIVAQATAVVNTQRPDHQDCRRRTTHCISPIENPTRTRIPARGTMPIRNSLCATAYISMLQQMVKTASANQTDRGAKTRSGAKLETNR